MPKKGKKKVETSSESESSSGPEDRTPAKKPKLESPAKSGSSKTADDVDYWPLTKNRQVRINEFKGKYFVDIREMYVDSSGDMKPGKKGISLPGEQFRKLIELIPDITKALEKKENN